MSKPSPQVIPASLSDEVQPSPNTNTGSNLTSTQGEAISVNNNTANDTVNTAANIKTPASTQNVTKKKSTNKSLQSENHEALSDAVAASGVNIRAEEEAMTTGLSISKRQIEQNTFINPNQLNWFMSKTLEEQGIKSVLMEHDVANLISASCQHYMTQIVSDTVVMMRHRRYHDDSSKARNKQNKNSKSKISKSNLNNKSEISKALRDLAFKHKEKEEKRHRRRIFLGLEENKQEEELVQDHKQTNLTASLMMSGSKKKKYSWMQSSSSVSNAIDSRGDNGIRYREAREEQSVVLRDLIAALENRRMGVSDVLLKGYARLKD